MHERFSRLLCHPHFFPFFSVFLCRYPHFLHPTKLNVNWGWGGGLCSDFAIQLFGLTAGFLTFARLVVPLRIALALALTPAMDKYVVKVFFNKGDAAASEKGDGAEAVEMTEPAEV